MSIVLNKIFWAFRKNFFRPSFTRLSPRTAPISHPHSRPMALGKSVSPPDIFPSV